MIVNLFRVCLTHSWLLEDCAWNRALIDYYSFSVVPPEPLFSIGRRRPISTSVAHHYYRAKHDPACSQSRIYIRGVIKPLTVKNVCMQGVSLSYTTWYHIYGTLVLILVYSCRATTHKPLLEKAKPDQLFCFFGKSPTMAIGDPLIILSICRRHWTVVETAFIKTSYQIYLEINHNMVVEATHKTMHPKTYGCLMARTHGVNLCWVHVSV